MFSNNEWMLNGKVVSVEEKTKGYWLSVKGIAENSTLFSSDIFRISCWISKRLIHRKPKGQISLSGRLVFKNKDCYFVADKIN